MLESLINPRKVERRPARMLFIGLMYASLSLLLVHFFFSSNEVLSKFSGMIVVTFCVMFSFPFMYFLMKKEEIDDEKAEGFSGIWKMHKDAIYAFIFLFLGFIIAFSFWYIVLQDSNLLNAQIKTYCMMNEIRDIEVCATKYSFNTPVELKLTGAFTKEARFFSLLENNFYVMVFTLLLSLIFGAGAIFVLAWNASVIAVAISVFTENKITGIPLGIGRYMIHGFPEVTAYFIAALAGGIFGVGIIKKGKMEGKLQTITRNVIILIFIALILLIIAAAIEVYITPLLFG